MPDLRPAYGALAKNGVLRKKEVGHITELRCEAALYVAVGASLDHSSTPPVRPKGRSYRRLHSHRTAWHHQNHTILMNTTTLTQTTADNSAARVINRTRAYIAGQRSWLRRVSTYGGAA